ncbi:MAG TPA: hypothetical protein VF173_38725 [Thermoanaerobaculia bacterium]|nr:hypothetical protein [Thermoanaerobaculia bacterium]
MRDEHFSRDTAEQFLRSELPKPDAILFVRHLLRQCPACGRLLREIAQRRSFRLMLLRGTDPLGDPSEPLLDRLKGRSATRSRALGGPWRSIRRA